MLNRLAEPLQREFNYVDATNNLNGITTGDVTGLASKVPVPLMDAVIIGTTIANAAVLTQKGVLTGQNVVGVFNQFATGNNYNGLTASQKSELVGLGVQSGFAIMSAINIAQTLAAVSAGAEATAGATIAAALAPETLGISLAFFAGTETVQHIANRYFEQAALAQYGYTDKYISTSNQLAQTINSNPGLNLLDKAVTLLNPAAMLLNPTTKGANGLSATLQSVDDLKDWVQGGLIGNLDSNTAFSSMKSQYAQQLCSQYCGKPGVDKQTILDMADSQARQSFLHATVPGTNIDSGQVMLNFKWGTTGSNTAIHQLATAWKVPDAVAAADLVSNIQSNPCANSACGATPYARNYYQTHDVQQINSITSKYEGTTFSQEVSSTTSFIYTAHWDSNGKWDPQLNSMIVGGQAATKDSAGLYETSTGSAYSLTQGDNGYNLQLVQFKDNGVTFSKVNTYGDQTSWAGTSGKDNIQMTLDSSGNLVNKEIIHTADGSRDIITAATGGEIDQQHYDSNSNLQWTVRSYQSGTNTVQQVLGADNTVLQTQTSQVVYQNGQKQVVTTITDRYNNVVGTTTQSQVYDSKSGNYVSTTVIKDAQGNPVQVRVQTAAAPPSTATCGGSTGTPCGVERDQNGNLPTSNSPAAQPNYSKSDTQVFNVNSDGSQSLAYTIKAADSTGTSQIVDPNNKPIGYQQTSIQGTQTITNGYGVNNDGSKGNIQYSQVTDLAGGVDGSTTTNYFATDGKTVVASQTSYTGTGISTSSRYYTSTDSSGHTTTTELQSINGLHSGVGNCGNTGDASGPSCSGFKLNPDGTFSYTTTDRYLGADGQMHVSSSTVNGFETPGLTMACVANCDSKDLSKQKWTFCTGSQCDYVDGNSAQYRKTHNLYPWLVSQGWTCDGKPCQGCTQYQCPDGVIPNIQPGQVTLPSSTPSSGGSPLVMEGGSSGFKQTSPGGSPFIMEGGPGGLKTSTTPSAPITSTQSVTYVTSTITSCTSAGCSTSTVTRAVTQQPSVSSASTSSGSSPFLLGGFKPPALTPTATVSGSTSTQTSTQSWTCQYLGLGCTSTQSTTSSGGSPFIMEGGSSGFKQPTNPVTQPTVSYPTTPPVNPYPYPGSSPFLSAVKEGGVPVNPAPLPVNPAPVPTYIPAPAPAPIPGGSPFLNIVKTSVAGGSWADQVSQFFDNLLSQFQQLFGVQSNNQASLGAIVQTNNAKVNVTNVTLNNTDLAKYIIDINGLTGGHTNVANIKSLANNSQQNVSVSPLLGS